MSLDSSAKPDQKSGAAGPRVATYGRRRQDQTMNPRRPMDERDAKRWFYVLVALVAVGAVVAEWHGVAAGVAVWILLLMIAP